MKIAYVVPTLGIGGTENQVLLLAGGIKRAGHEAAVICLYDCEGQEERAGEAGIRYFSLHAAGPFDVALPFKLYRLLKNERPDIVHTFLFDANTWGPFAAKMAGVRRVISARRNYDDWMRYPHVLLQRIANGFTDIITVNSAKVGEFVAKTEKADPAHMRVIYNGLDTTAFDKGARSVDPQRVREGFGIGENSKVVVTVANLKPSKGLGYLLEACAEIMAKKALDARFLIIGCGPLKQHLEQAAKRLGIAAHVIFAGLNRDVPVALSCADLAVNSSIREGMSNAVLEYMAAGLPVVATDAGGNAETVRDGLDGYIVSSRDASALAAKIELLLRDAALARTMGKNARKRIEEKFSVEKMVKDYEELYDELL